MKALNNPESCFICRRRADGFGVGKDKKVGWFCNECGTGLAKEVYQMTDRRFDVFEERAIEKAGQKAGEYLDDIGKTDLTTLDQMEWRQFLSTVIRSFSDGIRHEVQTGDAPF